ncbi:MAG TPA: DUF3795 domain-containing protein [Bacteroidales bacterium]|jgi:hypothetical protein|nr:DUF3795 domain-containing protein [Bacteroidales bacterium]
MNKLIACCGLNCETCDAFIATIKNSDELRKKTAEKWQQMFNAPEIKIESINCTGCRSAGVKFAHCFECKVRICANSKSYETCGECESLGSCKLVAMIHQYSPDALENLKTQN